jgi:hypothetical protein
VGAGVRGQEQRPLEALLDLPDPAQVDEEAAVDPEEPLVRELLLEAVEASGGGQEPSLVAGEPDVVVVGLGETDLPRIEQDPPVLPLRDDPAGQRAGTAPVSDPPTWDPPTSDPSAEPRASSAPSTWVPVITGRTVTGRGVPRKGT